MFKFFTQLTVEIFFIFLLLVVVESDVHCDTNKIGKNRDIRTKKNKQLKVSKNNVCISRVAKHIKLTTYLLQNVLGESTLGQGPQETAP